MRSPLVLTILIVLVASNAALASVTHPSLLSNPNAPTNGYYLRGDGVIMKFERATGQSGTLVPSGTTSTGPLLAGGECVFNDDGTCEGSINSNIGECKWATNAWTLTPSVSDFRWGQCMALRVYSTGTSAVAEYRPAVRLTASSVDGAEVVDVMGNWGYKLVANWYHGSEPLPTGQVNDDGVSINPYTISTVTSACVAATGGQTPALQGGHYIADCVFGRSTEFTIRNLVPAGLLDSEENPAVVDGFILSAILLNDGVDNGEAAMTCHSCFTPYTSPSG